MTARGDLYARIVESAVQSLKKVFSLAGVIAALLLLMSVCSFSVSEIRDRREMNDGPAREEARPAAVPNVKDLDVWRSDLTAALQERPVVVDYRKGTVVMPTDPKDLAKRFAAVLRDWLTEEELSAVNRANAQEKDPQICHSHDFCDSNQAMIDAMEFLGIELNLQDEQNVDLINKAWGLAKSSHFDPELVDATRVRVAMFWDNGVWAAQADDVDEEGRFNDRSLTIAGADEVVLATLDRRNTYEAWGAMRSASGVEILKIGPVMGQVAEETCPDVGS